MGPRLPMNPELHARCNVMAAWLLGDLSKVGCFGQLPPARRLRALARGVRAEGAARHRGVDPDVLHTCPLPEPAQGLLESVGLERLVVPVSSHFVVPQGFTVSVPPAAMSQTDQVRT